MAIQVSLCLVMLLPIAAPAQQLVKDIRVGSVGSQSASIPPMLDFYGTLLFMANDGVHGHELWKTDGSTAGTVMVKDIRPKSGSGNPQHLTIAGRYAFCVANDGTHGSEIWRTDGTQAGTMMVKNINPRTDTFLAPESLMAMGDRLFFSAHDGTPGQHLFVTDGTAAGTHLVSRLSYPRELTVFRGELYFTAADANVGRELYKTDGTTAGTVLVRDLYPGGTFIGPFWRPNNANPRYLTVIDDTLYFVFASAGGRYIAKSNGTGNGTIGIRFFPTGQPSSLTPVAGVILFHASDHRGAELWRTDGTYRGTFLVKDIYPGSSGSNPAYVISSGGFAYFQAKGPTGGRELWRSDGSPAGTTLVKDLWPGSTGSAPHQLTNIGSRGFCFSAEDASKGKEVWISGGTAASTVRVSDINPNRAHGSPAYFLFVGGRMFFWADDGKHGRELWRLEVGATAQSFGVSCGVGDPGLRATDPVIGGTMTVIGERAPTVGHLGFLMVGAPRRPLSVLGCSNIYYTAFTASVELYGFFSASRRWSLKVPVPNDAKLIGQVVTAQSHYLSVPNSPPDLRLTNGVRLTVGR